MSNEGKSQQLRFKNGRKIGYSEYGAPNGIPAFYFHGFFLLFVKNAWILAPVVDGMADDGEIGSIVSGIISYFE